MKQLLVIFSLLPSIALFAQKKEEILDASYKPTTDVGRYYVVTEKKSDHWYREVYYIAERSLAESGTYKDENCKIPHGEIKSYYPNKMMQSTINYVDGKMSGIYLKFHQNGMMRDSIYYLAGNRKGVGLGWDQEGYLIDSSNFDGAGNGTEVRWFPGGGHVFSTGRYMNDTVKVNRWKYYHSNGQTLAYEDYNNGKRIACSCYDESGKQLDSLACVKEEEASFPGLENGWRRFLEKNLDPEVPLRHRAPVGTYTVVVSFVVNSNGQVMDIKASTNFGYGMEEEVIRLIKKSPQWKPAFQFGRNVKAYRKQPVTFVVTKG